MFSGKGGLSPCAPSPCGCLQPRGYGSVPGQPHVPRKPALCSLTLCLGLPGTADFLSSFATPPISVSLRGSHASALGLENPGIQPAASGSRGRVRPARLPLPGWGASRASPPHANNVQGTRSTGGCCLDSRHRSLSPTEQGSRFGKASWAPYEDWVPRRAGEVLGAMFSKFQKWKGRRESQQSVMVVCT